MDKWRYFLFSKMLQIATLYVKILENFFDHLFHRFEYLKSSFHKFLKTWRTISFCRFFWLWILGENSRDRNIFVVIFVVVWYSMLNKLTRKNCTANCWRFQFLNPSYDTFNHEENFSTFLHIIIIYLLEFSRRKVSTLPSLTQCK